MKTKKINLVLALLILVGVLQFAVICYFNLTQLEQHIGYDTSTYYYTAIEMWEQKSILLDKWEYQTTLNIDSTAPLAAVFYGIIGNIFTAYGLANIVITIVFIFVFNSFLKRFPISDISKAIAVNLSMVLHFALAYNNANSLYYGDVMFIQNAAYNIKTILALWILIVAMDLYEGKKNKISACACVFMCGVSGFSSGYWILATTALPLLVLEIVKRILDQDWKDWWKSSLNQFIGASIIASLAGKIAVGVILDYQSKESLMTLISIEKLWKNMGSILQGYLDLLTALPQDGGVEALTFDGVCFGINFLFAAFIIIGAVYSVRKKEYDKNYREQVVLAVIVVNLLIFIFMDTTYGSRFFEVRYLILIFLLGLQYMAKIFDVITTKINVKFLGICTAAMIMLINISSNLPYYKDKTNYDELKNIIETVGKYDTPVVYTFGDDMILDSRNLRVLDLTKVYKQVNSNMKVRHWGDTLRYDDLGEWTGMILILTTEDEIENFPDYIRKDMKKAEEVGKYTLYQLPENRFDFVSAFGYGNKINIDTVHSPGIYMKDDGADKKDEIIENKADEGKYVMFGPYQPSRKGCYNLIMKYELEGEAGNSLFDVAIENGANILGSVMLEKGEHEAVISNVQLSDSKEVIEYRVYLDGKNIIQVHSITIEEVQKNDYE